MTPISIAHHIKNTMVLILLLGGIQTINSQDCFASANSVSFSAEGGNAQRTLLHNCFEGTFAIGGTPDWISASVSGQIVYITAFPNAGAARNGTIVLMHNGQTSGGVTVEQDEAEVPAIPAITSITNNCGNTVIARGNPPVGVTWYWQDSAVGTSTANSDPSVIRTSGTTYYLRGKNDGADLWGMALPVNYTVDPEPIWYPDTDGDGFGEDTPGLAQCDQPDGYVANNTDVCPNEAGPDNGCPLLHTPATQSDENYIFTRVYQQAMLDPNDIQNDSDVIENITYYDGLGRPKQQIGIKASPNKKDIVTHIEYDEYGRQPREYLPFEQQTGETGSFTIVNILQDINSYYQNQYPDDFTAVAPEDVNAYAEKVFEPSPLNRIVKQGAPGKDWKADPTTDTDHTIKFDWGTNDVEEVKYFNVDFTDPGNTEAPTLAENGYYETNELYVGITKDENWQPEDGNLYTTREYKDKLGRVILKRSFVSPSLGGGQGEDELSTYYIYDDYNNLTFVIPPKVTTADGVSGIELSELCYQYRYDHRNRLVEKKIPGKEWEYIIYNTLDQPILTQDAIQRPNDQWLFTKYDPFGRVAYTGLYVHPETISRTDLQALAEDTNTYTQYVTKEDNPTDLAGTPVYYSNDAFPTGISEVYTINYYDNYTFDHTVVAPVTVYEQAVTENTQGLATASKVRVLDTDDWITTLTYYDQKGRPIYTHSTNDFLNTTDSMETQLDFVGKVLATSTTHTKDSHDPIVTIDTFTYDHTGRQLDHIQKINDQEEERITSNEYDGLGQLIQKKVGGIAPPLGEPEGAGLQTINYTYNIRGWLKNINDPNSIGNDLFAFGIAYNDISDPTKKLYNGNISQTSWRTANTDNSLREYTYAYDALNRITEAIDNTGNYQLHSITYDKVGNILSLHRNGYQNDPDYTDMDVLSYGYDSGNKLLQVTDTGNSDYGFKDGDNIDDDYDYDENGNMIIDQNKGITNIAYNHLNLPELITFTPPPGPYGGTRTIGYVYDATGVKLQKSVSDILGTGVGPTGTIAFTRYAGNYIYEETENADGIQLGLEEQLKFGNHTEGYTIPENDGSFSYVYQYKDHLGNIRLSYSDLNTDGAVDASEIMEEKNYYPFGLTHQGYNGQVQGAYHPYGYNGKEENDELGLAWLDFSARNYNPALGRWMNLDPLAEQMRRHSPYNYTFNNPIFFIDSDGMAPTFSDPIKRILKSTQTGNVNPTRKVLHKYRVERKSIWDFKSPNRTDLHTIPASGSSTIGVSTEFSAMQDNFGGVAKFITEGRGREYTYSVSSEVKTVIGQYFDASGNTVSNIKEASSYTITTNIETTTINILGQVSGKANVTSISSSTSYDVTERSGLSEFSGKQLTNPITNIGEPTITTISLDNVSSTLQNYAKEKVKENFISGSKEAIDYLNEATKRMEENLWKSLEKY